MALTKPIKSVEDTNEDEAPVSRTHERDADQLARDADAKALHAAWEAAGKPDHATLTSKAGFKVAKKVVYLVSKDDRKVVKDMIRRACLLYKGIPVYVKDLTTEDGEIRIKWTYSPPAPKAETPAETPTAPPAETPAAPPAPDAETTHEVPAGQAGEPQSGRRGGLLGTRR